MRTGKQQIATNVTSEDQLALCQDPSICAGGVKHSRLWKTCREICDEERSFLHHSSTFVFLAFATFAVYFELIAPKQAYIHRSIDNRLHAIQAMTNVELHGHFGGTFSAGFLSASHLIRTGLGCLTSLKLNLEDCADREKLPHWKIDDCMFNQPSSLRKFEVDVQTFIPRSLITEDQILTTEKEDLNKAEEIMRRILKEEQLCGTTEQFLGYDRTAAFKVTDAKMEGFLTRK